MTINHKLVVFYSKISVNHSFLLASKHSVWRRSTGGHYTDLIPGVSLTRTKVLYGTSDQNEGVVWYLGPERGCCMVPRTRTKVLYGTSDQNEGVVWYLGPERGCCMVPRTRTKVLYGTSDQNDLQNY